MLSRDEGSKFLHRLCRHYFFYEVVPVENGSDEEAVSVVVCFCTFALPKEKQRLVFLVWNILKICNEAHCPSPTVSALVAHLQTDRMQYPLSLIPVRAWNCATTYTGTCFHKQSTSVVLSARSSSQCRLCKHLCIRWENKQKALKAQGHSAMLRAPSGAGFQTQSKVQKTLRRHLKFDLFWTP